MQSLRWHHFLCGCISGNWHVAEAVKKGWNKTCVPLYLPALGELGQVCSLGAIWTGEVISSLIVISSQQASGHTWGEGGGIYLVLDLGNRANKQEDHRPLGKGHSDNPQSGGFIEACAVWAASKRRSKL